MIHAASSVPVSHAKGRTRGVVQVVPRWYLSCKTLPFALSFSLLPTPQGSKRVAWGRDFIEPWRKSRRRPQGNDHHSQKSKEPSPKLNAGLRWCVRACDGERDPAVTADIRSKSQPSFLSPNCQLNPPNEHPSPFRRHNR